jgi:hypothetical protein
VRHGKELGRQHLEHKERRRMGSGYRQARRTLGSAANVASASGRRDLVRGGARARCGAVWARTLSRSSTSTSRTRRVRLATSCSMRMYFGMFSV